MNNKTLAIVTIAAIAALLVATAVIGTTDSVSAKKYKKTQTTAQANACGNGSLPLGIFCQTLNSQIQGDDNAVNIIGVQP